MRNLLIILLLLPLNNFGQQIKVTNNFRFNNGIYTCFAELINNSPRYLKCKLDIERPPVGLPKYYYYDSLQKKHTFYDSCFAVVTDGMLFIRQEEVFIKGYYLGSITILKASGMDLSANFVDLILLLDFETGKIVSLFDSFLTDIFQRDLVLYEEFMNDQSKNQTNKLISYIIKYNNRNPLYLKSN
jgi:ribosomal protein S17E